MRTRIACFALLFSTVTGSTAWARPSLEVTPKKVRAGDALLVEVTGPGGEPRGKAGTVALRFFKVKGGWQAVAAVPLENAPPQIVVAAAGQERSVQVAERELPEADIKVAEEYATPPPDARDRIARDNDAIIAAYNKEDGRPRFTAAFRMPGKGKKTSLFGEWRVFNDGYRSQHLGLDIAAKEGTRVNSVNHGRVVLISDGYLIGKSVVVAHGAGIYSAYFHLSDVSVSEGAEVERGGAIGRVGATGRTTGPHIHVSTWVPGGYVDPVSLFSLKIGPLVPQD